MCGNRNKKAAAALSAVLLVTAAACTPGSSTRPAADPDSCAKILANERGVLAAAERITPTTPSNGYRRYATLDSPRDVTLGIRGTSAGAGLLEIYAAFESSCGRPAADRMLIYDTWAQVLRDQALEAVQLQRPGCRVWSRAGARYDIALDAEALRSLMTRFGSTDPDVSHIESLLKAWARRWGVELPGPVTALQLDRFISSYGRVYDSASSKAPASC